MEDYGVRLAVKVREAETASGANDARAAANEGRFVATDVGAAASGGMAAAANGGAANGSSMAANGGGAAADGKPVTAAEVAAIVREALAELRVYVLESDITDAQNAVRAVVEKAKF